MFLYQPTPSELNEKWVTHMLQHVGIEFTEVVWQIDLTNEDGQAVCASRLTMAVINKAQPVYS